MRAGTLDRYVALQQKAAPTAPDPESGAWTTTVSVHARRLDPSGAERYLGRERASQGSVVYVIRYRTDVDPTWRLLDGTEYWNIEGAFEGEGRRRETVLVCTRYTPNNPANG